MMVVQKSRCSGHRNMVVFLLFLVVYIGEVAEAEVAVSIFFLSASSRNLMGTMTDVRT